jgi:hypothetical protein
MDDLLSILVFFGTLMGPFVVVAYLVKTIIDIVRYRRRDVSDPNECSMRKKVLVHSVVVSLVLLAAVGACVAIVGNELSHM